MKIFETDFDEVSSRGLVASAKAEGITIRRGDRIFSVQGEKAVGCLRMIGSGHARLCDCYVDGSSRGRGAGTALVLHRLNEAVRVPSVRVVDTYAFRSRLFISIGFEAVRSFSIGTTLLRWDIKSAELLVQSDGITQIGRSRMAEIYHGSMTMAEFHVDLIASDPPWRQGNLSYWSNRAGISQRWPDFVANMSRHFSANAVYLKTGLPESEQWVSSLASAGMKHVIKWETRYSGGQNAQIVASRTVNLDELPMEEESRSASTAIAKWAFRFGLRTAADPCVGEGKMLDKFRVAGLRVAGVELIRDRAQRAAVRLCV